MRSRLRIMMYLALIALSTIGATAKAAPAAASTQNVTITATGIYKGQTSTGIPRIDCENATLIVNNQPFPGSLKGGLDSTHTQPICVATFKNIPLDKGRQTSVDIKITATRPYDAGPIPLEGNLHTSLQGNQSSIGVNLELYEKTPSDNRPSNPRPTEKPAVAASVPTNVKAKAIDPYTIQVTWNEPANQAVDFLINDNKDSLGVWVQAERNKSDFSYTASGLTPGHQYCYRVSARREVRSMWSDWACTYTPIRVTNAH
jgi:hypothetical protein